jgi:opacity protein-like surface antigen
MGADGYNIDSQYTAGIGLEVDIDENFAGTVGYSYSQFNVGLANANPYYNQYYPYPNSYSQNSMEYNQNVFEAGLRMYLLPKTSKFRLFMGGGLGFNKGYLHYKQNNNINGAYPGYNPGINSGDYTVTSFLGALEAGADLQFSKSIAVGGLLKYYKVLSTKDNQPQNGYYGNGYYPGDLSQIGRAISDNNFYSILGTVKVSF